MRRPHTPILLLASAAALSLLLPPYATPATTPAVPTTAPTTGNIYVFGDVPRSGIFEIGPKPLALRRAIVNAGIPREPTPHGYAVLASDTPPDRSDVYKIDLAPLMRDDAGDLFLRPKDRIDVQLTPP